MVHFYIDNPSLAYTPIHYLGYILAKKARYSITIRKYLYSPSSLFISDHMNTSFHIYTSTTIYTGHCSQSSMIILINSIQSYTEILGGDSTSAWACAPHPPAEGKVKVAST